VSFRKFTKNSPLWEKSQTAEVVCEGKVVGTLGLLNSYIATYFGVDVPVAACEINLTTTYNLQPIPKSYHAIPKFPPMIEDISAIFGKETLVADIISTVKKSGAPLVKQIEILDIYQDKKIGDSKKSITLRLTYQNPNGTPTQEEVTQTRNTIESALTKIFQAEVRK
jgi:phenylalanyl-tRNA synthetase beta chain